MKRLRVFLGSPILQNICIIVLLCLLVIPFYSNRVFSTGVNAGEDILEQDIPHVSFFLDNLGKGTFPLWNPHKVCGLPFFEVSFMGPHYPLVFLYFIFSLLKAINIGFLSHILFSAIFMFFLAKELKFTRFVSFFCASSWMLSSVFQQYSESGWLTEAIAMSYLPCLIYLFLKITKSEGILRVILSLLTSLSVGLMIVGGKPDFTVVVLYSFLMFSLFFLRKKGLFSLLSIILLGGFLLSIISWGPILIQAARYGWPGKLETVGYSFGDIVNFILPFSIRRGFVGRLVLILGCIGIFSKKGPFTASFRLMALASLFFMFGGIKIGELELINFIPLVNQATNIWIWQAGFIFSLIIFAGAALERLGLYLSRGSGNKKTILLIVLILVFGVQLADLYYFNKKFYPQDFKYKLEEYFLRDPFIDLFKKDPSLFRTCSTFYQVPSFRISQPMVEGINSFAARTRGVNLYKITGESTLSYKLSGFPARRVRDICNLKYIMAHFPISSGYLEQVLAFRDEAAGQTIYLYRNKLVFPRSFLLEDVDQSLVNEVLVNNYSASLFSLEIPDEAWTVLSKYKQVDTKYSPNTYTISSDSDTAGFLFLSEMNEPGWQAEVDGEPVEISYPFNFFMGVFLPAGKHSVVFQFKPLYFYAFSIISLVTFLGLIGSIACFTYKYRRSINNSSK